MDRLARTIFGGAGLPKWRRRKVMAVTRSRRDVLNLGYGTAATLGVSALTSAGALGPVRALAQGAPAVHAPAEDFFYRDDWFGEPWRKPEAAVLIHGNEESSLVWYAWMPRMGQEFRVVRPDLPGLGRSRIPAGFEWSLPSLAAYVAHVMDRAGADSAHIIGAKAGGAIAMQFAADYPARTRTLSVVHQCLIAVTSSDVQRWTIDALMLAFNRAKNSGELRCAR